MLTPVIDAVERNVHCVLAFGRHRVVIAKTLDEATITAIAFVGGNDMKERTLLGAASGKTNDNHADLGKRYEPEKPEIITRDPRLSQAPARRCRTDGRRIRQRMDEKPLPMKFDGTPDEMPGIGG